ncbi:MAG: dephospho-CoA kinase [Chlamydiales bacterium]|nr:dephospho-CoA kinase [Chlamydiales bacterium]
MKKVAVTGSLSSGKTTVCRLFEELGAYVVSADAIVHQLLIPTTPIGQKIIDLLGSVIVAGNKLNREEIAARAFRDPSLLEELEKRIHPEVQKVIEAKYQEVFQKPFTLFIAEVPLLFESGQQGFYDAVVVVRADKESSRRRFIASTPYDEAEFERRERRLMPIEEKCRRADFVLDNSLSLNELRLLVKTTFNSLKG